MKLFAVMWQKGVNEWEVCQNLDMYQNKIAAVFKTRKGAEEDLKKWVNDDGSDNYKVAKLDVVVMD